MMATTPDKRFIPSVHGRKQLGRHFVEIALNRRRNPIEPRKIDARSALRWPRPHGQRFERRSQAAGLVGLLLVNETDEPEFGGAPRAYQLLAPRLHARD